MNEVDKLRVLIPHWIEHNDEHAEEFKRWAEQTNEASLDILAAAETMILVNNSLRSALKKLGGPLNTDLYHHHEHDQFQGKA